MKYGFYAIIICSAYSNTQYIFPRAVFIPEIVNNIKYIAFRVNKQPTEHSLYIQRLTPR